MSIKSNNEGFTIVELLVAITFFSFLLLLVTYGFVQINRTYTRGITSKTIQDTARTTIEDIARTLRFSDDVIEPQLATAAPGAPENISWRAKVGGYCYIWNQQDPAEENTIQRTEAEYTGTANEELVLVRGDAAKYCGSPYVNVDEDDTEKLLDQRAAVQHLDISRVSNDTYQVTVVISTKQAMDNDLDKFGLNAVCKVQIGDQFCDVAKYETTVHTRN